ncbi:MAG: lysylphosphatidylglycerol synthase transmembrane domain-containing protein [Byssovorax sp.]
MEASSTTGDKRRFAVRALIRLLGPALLVLVILRIKDRGAVLDALTQAAWAPMLAATLLNLANVHLKVVRWQQILETRGIRYPLRRAWPAFMSSVYLGMLTPGRVGDVLRIQYLRHDLDVPYAEGLASIVVDRLCDLYVLALFVAVGVVHYSPVIVGQLAWITWGGVAAIIIGPLVFLVPGVAERTMGRVYARLAKGSTDDLGVFLAAVRASMGRPLLRTIPMTALAFGVNYVQGYVIADSMGLDMSFFDAMCLLAIASLLGLLPISVSGVGVRELFFALVFPLLGFTPAAGVTFGLLVFFVIYLVNIGIGFVSFQLAPPPAAKVTKES